MKTSPPSPAFPNKSLILLLSSLLSAPLSALEPTVGHGEIETTYDPTTQTWAWTAEWYDDDLNFHQSPINSIFVPGYDRPSNVLQGIRRQRPTDPKWDFLGMAAGEPVWVYADSSYASLGFQSTPANLLPDLTFRLQSVLGPPGGQFSMYSGTAPTVHFSTTDGIGTGDTFVKPGSHTHVNWAFSKPGLWILFLTVEGTLATTNQPTAASSPQPLVFAVGPYARWKATHFSLQELLDPSTSGDLADPDHDGFSTLLEYCLGGDPKSASSKRETDALPLAPELLRPTAPGAPWQLRYTRRINNTEPEILPAVQSNTGGLAPANWTTAGGTETVQTVDGTWERVTLTLAPVPLGTSAFYRLEATSQ